MRNLSFCLLLVWLLGISAGALADKQMCHDLYSADAYEAEERKVLIQDCLAAYAPEPTYEDNTSEASYYEGTVEDFVNEIPTEEDTSWE